MALSAQFAGCRDRGSVHVRGDTSGALRSAERRTSRRIPLAWRENPDQLQFLRVDLFGAGDAARVSCDSTGVFAREESGRIFPLRVGSSVCEQLWIATEVALSPDGKFALLAAPQDEGSAIVLNLIDFSRKLLRTQCAARTFAWSKRGDRFAVVEDCGDSIGGGGRLEVTSVTGEGGTRLLVRGAVGHASWSPDGRSIAVTRRSTAGEQIISIVSIAKHLSVQLVRGRDPAWSPRGDWIAYIAIDRAGAMTREIRAVRADGRADHRLAVIREGSALMRLLSGPIVWSRRSDKIAVALGEELFVLSTVDSANTPIQVR